MSTKHVRLAILSNLVQQGFISSQSDAVSALEQHNIEATQATVSRDLAEIGAVRRTRAGRTLYELAHENSSFGMSLSRVLKEFIVRKVASGQLVVLHTPPGHASVVAAAIDRTNISGILGVIAGDDTIFIACNADVGAQKVLQDLLNYA
jgi:transcriptional regulator of arginine metabolism